MMITGTQLAKALPEAFSVSDLRAMKSERTGKNWVSWCNKTFQGGYIAVHNILNAPQKAVNKKVVVSENYKAAAKQFVQDGGRPQLVLYNTQIQTPADRAASVLSSGLHKLSYTSRQFLCNLIVRDVKVVSPKQEKWLSDLEANT